MEDKSCMDDTHAHLSESLETASGSYSTGTKLTPSIGFLPNPVPASSIIVGKISSTAASCVSAVVPAGKDPLWRTNKGLRKPFSETCWTAHEMLGDKRTQIKELYTYEVSSKHYISMPNGIVVKTHTTLQSSLAAIREETTID